MALNQGELIRVKAEQNDDSEIEVLEEGGAFPYDAKETSERTILRECDNCKVKTEKEELLCFNLFGETDGCRPTFVGPLSPENMKSDEFFKQIYGPSPKFIGRSFEVCTCCRVFRVHNLFSRMGNELSIKLSLGGFAQAICSNVIQTCESKGKNVKCHMVGICSIPRSSPAYAILQRDVSLDQSQGLKVTPKEGHLYPQSLLAAQPKVGCLATGDYIGRTRLENAISGVASFDEHQGFSNRKEVFFSPLTRPTAQKHFSSPDFSGSFGLRTVHGVISAESMPYNVRHDYNDSPLGQPASASDYSKSKYRLSPSAMESNRSLRISPNESISSQNSCSRSNVVSFASDAFDKSSVSIGKRPHLHQDEHTKTSKRLTTPSDVLIKESTVNDKILDNRTHSRDTPAFSVANDLYFENRINQSSIASDVEVVNGSESPLSESVIMKASASEAGLSDSGVSEANTFRSNLSLVSEWSNEDVVTFFAKTDCAEYASVFEEEEIDGKALLLLNEEKLNKLLGIKIGPAMKIARQIEGLKTWETPRTTSNSE